MTSRCIFCEKELTMMQKKKLHCGNTTQTLCGTCYHKYKGFTAVERAEAAMKTGRAEDATKLGAYLETVREAQSEKIMAAEEKRKQRISELSCLRCGEKMLDYGPLTFKLGEETCFFSDINRLISGSVTMQLLRCDSCGKVEFFMPDAKELEGLIGEKSV